MKKPIILCFVLALSLLSAGIVVRLPEGGQVNLYSDYYALIIGNSDYQYFPKLRGVKKDVQDIKAMFDRLGIHSEVQEDLSGQQMLEVLNRFIAGYGTKADRGLIIYYAGHGYTEDTFAGKQVGYIVPVDAPLYNKDVALFRQLGVSMNKIKELASLIQSRHVLMIFDSCFAGTIFRGNPGVPKAIEAKVAEPVRQFITAGDANEEVPDASIFKSTLKKGLEDGDADTNGDGFITGQELGYYLSLEVTNYSNGSQHPQYGKLNEPDFDRGDFVFALAKPVQPMKVETTAPPKPQIETVWLYGNLEVETNLAGDLYLNGDKFQSLAAGQKAKISKLVTG
ncbi:MAG TPA: caspase family protein, partial [Candidatus Cloacimonadota bacterium]|nr:caspase family protein [Candidatus Cloacimonadota bacterium]